MNLSQKKIVFVCGSGGVGKTTLTSSLGLYYATQGKKVALLTVDPARRLAQALGLESLSSELRKVSIDGPGELYASMLDTRRYLDNLIERLSKNPEQKQKIVENPLYKVMADFLGGSQEYAAMEQVFDIHSENKYDLLVVDTPPTQNAVDLLGAPQKLVDFFDTSLFRWFDNSKGLFSKLINPGTQAVLQLLEKLFGKTFWSQFTHFMRDLSSLRQGFVERHSQIRKLFESPTTAFLLVLTASDSQWKESLKFQEKLSTMNISLESFVLNRLFVKPSFSEDHSDFSKFYRKLIEHQVKMVTEITNTDSETTIIPLPITAEASYERASLLELGEILYNERHEKRQWKNFLPNPS